MASPWTSRNGMQGHDQEHGSDTGVSHLVDQADRENLRRADDCDPVVDCASEIRALEILFMFRFRRQDRLGFRAGDEIETAPATHRQVGPGVSAARRLFLCCALLLSWTLLPTATSAAPKHVPERPLLVIPRTEQPPSLEDFLEMRPNAEMDGRLARVEDFVQRRPSDGAPPSQRTEAYLGYDHENLYVVMICFDSEPERIRARMTRREDIFADDKVFVSLDTFHDQLRSYTFGVNPLGIQYDSYYTEGGQEDRSFDTLWHSRGRLTNQGYVVWMAFPFKSLRFRSRREQTWGIILWRSIPRINETTTWPHVSIRLEGLLNQAGRLRGPGGISPGSNVHLIPYGFLRSFRALDTSAPEEPRFVTDRAELDAGLDAKFVLQDSFTLDLAANADFSQVESDEPQVTVNRRFEIFFPEKRPFFLENADFFQTPINLFFSRRIRDPRLGVRLTGKKGPFAIGALLADDESPGKGVPAGDPLEGKRARFGIVRINSEIRPQSTLGLIYADREFEGSFNRVGGLDGRLKLNQSWVASFQGVASRTRLEDGTRLAGPAYEARLLRQGRQFFYHLEYKDRSPGFRTQTGFLSDRRVKRLALRSRRILRPSPRPDVRGLSQFVTYRFRPEGDYLLSWGPTVLVNPIWDHDGTRLNQYYDYGLGGELIGLTALEFFYTTDRELLRPQEFSVLSGNREFPHNRKGVFFQSSYFPQVTFRGEYSSGTGINFRPPEAQEPVLANLTRGNLSLILRPVTRLQVENTYLLERLIDRANSAPIFNNHIFRSKWNWQFNRELSLRVILQYNTVLSNPRLTSLETSKNLNADFLFTYLVNPWTALYMGYNGNLQNLDLVDGQEQREVVRSQDFINDAKQFFIKVSYLLRF